LIDLLGTGKRICLAAREKDGRIEKKLSEVMTIGSGSLITVLLVTQMY
jgi:hypothetical protein